MNDTRVYNETLGNETVAMKAYHMCTCDIHEIKLSAIDVCGNIGKNYSLFVKKPESFPDLECEKVIDPTYTSLATSNRHGGILIIALNR